MKKNILLVFGLLLLLAACDRKSFVKKIVGNYKLDKYLYSGQPQTDGFDSVYRNWQLHLGEDETYTKTWIEYVFRTDTIYLGDTVGYDTPNMSYLINYDTLEVVDTSKMPHIQTGKWDLLNSEEDLQFRSPGLQSGDTIQEIYRILDYGKSNLTLRKGNEELYLKK